MNQLLSKPIVIITHSSTFHADEVFGCALLRHFAPSHLYMVRTLGIEDAVNKFKSVNSHIVVLDIGQKIEEAEGVSYLDHHQDKNIPCAAVLAKEWLKKQLPEKAGLIERTCRDWLPGVDSHDRGLAKMEDGIQTLSQIIATFLPEDMGIVDSQFFKALEFAEGHVARCAVIAETQIKEEEIINQKVAAANKNYLVFDKYLRATGPILSKREDDSILFFIYPHNRGGFALQTVSQKGVMTPRKLIPADIAGASFVHAAGFLANFPTFELAIAAAESLK